MVSYETLIRFAKTLDGQTLHTDARGKEFRLHVIENGLTYTPSSTGRLRNDPEMVVCRVLDRYNQTGSLRPGDYQDLTMNASYLLVIIARLQRGSTA